MNDENASESNDAVEDEHRLDQLDDEKQRLAVYGLATLGRRSNLTVNEGESINVTLRGGGAERYERSARYLPVKTVDDLKRMIGVPEEVARQRCRCPEELSASFPPGFETIEDMSPWQRDLLRAAADAYVHGDSQLVAHHAPAINKALTLVGKAKISLVYFQDIIVERNAVLTVSPSVDVLYARKVLIKRDGKVRFTSRLKIDCLSIEGQEGYVKFSDTPTVERALGVADLAQGVKP